MPKYEVEPVWPARLEKLDCETFDIRFPRAHGLDQDAEWCDIGREDGQRERIRLHDYSKIYSLPGLYEQLFYDRLACTSPTRVAHLLENVVADSEEELSDLRVLDVGAGNGMVGEELHVRGADRIVGVDIIAAAKDAALRDRGEVYDDYYVADLTDLPEAIEERLRKHDFNCLSTVAALGFGDIPPKAFLKALDVISTPGWLAFNIKEDFLAERDSTGFSELIRELNRDEVIQIQALRRYRHRLSITGRPLFYVAVIAQKLVDVPDHFMDR